jgi:hypothetical protein
MSFLGLGWPLHPDLSYLEATRPIIEDDADYFEVNPETLWRPRPGTLSRNGVPDVERNGFHALYRQFRDRSHKPFVAHGLDFSPATPVAEDRERTDVWLARLRDDHSVFDFQWMSEHLGWSTDGRLQGVLTLPMPYNDETRGVIVERMKLLQSVVPTACFENNPTYFSLGDPAREPEFFNEICRRARCGLMLDLHNVHTQCLNWKLDPDDYVGRLDLAAVVQIHISGGSESEPEWTPSRRIYRLDSHDGPVPEPVWSMLERVLPRCPNLRGVVLERLNGTFVDVGPLRDEVRRTKELIRAR